MPEVYRCKELARMWRIESETNAGTNAWKPFRRKLKQAIAYDPRKLHRLIDVLWDEIERERDEMSPDEHDDRVRRLEGRGRDATDPDRIARRSCG